MPTPAIALDLAARLTLWLDGPQEVPDASLVAELYQWAAGRASTLASGLGADQALDAILNRVVGVDRTRKSVFTRLWAFHHTVERVRDPVSWISRDLRFAASDLARKERRMRPLSESSESMQPDAERDPDALAGAAAATGWGEPTATSPEALPRAVRCTLSRVEQVIEVGRRLNGPSLDRLQREVRTVGGYMDRDLRAGAGRLRWVAAVRACPAQDAWSRAWQARYYRWLLDHGADTADPRPYTSGDEIPSAQQDRASHNRFSTHVARFRALYDRAFDATEPWARTQGALEWTGVQHETLGRRK